MPLKTSEEAAAEIAIRTKGRLLHELSDSEFSELYIDHVFQETMGPVIEEDLKDACKTYRLLNPPEGN